MANILVDDASLSSLALGPLNQTWARVDLDRFFGGSAIYPPFAGGDSGIFGWLSFSFQGTGISLYGNTPGPPASQNFFISIDGGQTDELSYGDPTPPSSIKWYQSPTLSDGTHTVNITHLAGTSIDFVVVKAGPSTPLRDSETALIVDDNESSISYTGDWKENHQPYTSSFNPHRGWPLGNGTHVATSAGPSAAFRFSGTSVFVYGIRNYAQLGQLSVKYTLDGASSSIVSYDITSSSKPFRDGFLEHENTLMYSVDSLVAGDHTLTMEVVACSNQTFALDYILYKPSFNTILDKPDLTAISSSSKTSTSTASPSVTNSSGGVVENTNHKSSAGAIAGGVVGGVIAFLLLALLLVFWRRRGRKSVTEEKELVIESSMVVQPFTGHSYWTGASTTEGTKRNSSSQLVPNRPPMQTEKSGTTLPSPPDANLETYSSDPALSYTVSGSDGAFRNRMQRLEELVSELNREMELGESDSSRVAELRGRIFELTREDCQVAEYVGRLGERNSAIPPPYDFGSAP